MGLVLFGDEDTFSGEHPDSIHVTYGQPASFYLKAPTLLYVFVFIALRALRFEARYVLLAGASAALGWGVLGAYVLTADPADRMLAHDFVDYLTSNSILIGAEIDKGNRQNRETTELYEHSDLNFVGNVEAHQLAKGAVDVAVCDGFVGNVVMKLTEGIGEAMDERLRERLISGRARGSARAASRPAAATGRSRAPPRAPGRCPRACVHVPASR